MNTFCIHNKITDPYFNLAAEEYFLKNFNENFFIFWRGDASIVVGKHQNALAEINHAFVRQNQIKIARRITGGGTVFHDLGNLNFTFIQNVEKIQEVNFKTFTVPVVKALRNLRINAYASDRNDLLIDGKKISGNAEHVHKKRVLHHGTLLYNSNLGRLKDALKVDLSRFEGKAVQSNRSLVTNIVDYMKDSLSVEAFGNLLFDEIKAGLADSKEYKLSSSDIQSIQKLTDEKYKTWDWIFGYSPRYVFRNTCNYEDGQLQLKFRVEKGRISHFELNGLKSQMFSKKLDEKLSGSRHDWDTIRPIINSLQNDLLFEKINPKIFLHALF